MIHRDEILPYFIIATLRCDSTVAVRPVFWMVEFNQKL